MAEVNAKSEVEKLKAELEAEKKKNQTLSAAIEKSNSKIKDLEKAAGKKEKDVNKKTYVVKQRYYWNGVLYNEDDIVDVPENLTPPPTFFEPVAE